MNDALNLGPWTPRPTYPNPPLTPTEVDDLDGREHDGFPSSPAAEVPR